MHIPDDDLNLKTSPFFAPVSFNEFNKIPSNSFNFVLSLPPIAGLTESASAATIVSAPTVLAIFRIIFLFLGSVTVL